MQIPNWITIKMNHSDTRQTYPCKQKEIVYEEYEDVLNHLSDLESDTEDVYFNPEHSTAKKPYLVNDERFVQYFDALLEKIFRVCCFDECSCCEKIKNVICNHQQFCTNDNLESQDELDFDNNINETETTGSKIHILSNIRITGAHYTNSPDNHNGSFMGSSVNTEQIQKDVNEDRQYPEDLSNKTKTLDELFDELAGITTKFEKPALNGTTGSIKQKRKRNGIREQTKRSKLARSVKNLDISYNENDLFVLKNSSNVCQTLTFNNNKEVTPNKTNIKTILKVTSEEKSLKSRNSWSNISRVTFDDEIQVIDDIENSEKSNKTVQKFTKNTKKIGNRANKQPNKKNKRKARNPKRNLDEYLPILSHRSVPDDSPSIKSSPSPSKKARKLYSPEDWVSSQEFEKYFEHE